MLSISQQSFDALSTEVYRAYVRQVAQDLTQRYPERFFMIAAPQVEAYVQSRIDYAAHFEITRNDCVAELMFVECECMADFPGQHANGWWAEILEEDGTQEYKVGRLWTAISLIEVHPGYRPEHP